MTVVTQFVRDLRELSCNNAFNPYSDRCDEYDLDDAPSIRLTALSAMLNVAQEVEIDSLWIGRDLGYRGGRRTGLALTDDRYIGKHAERWGITIERATRGEVVVERTASVIWHILSRLEGINIFLWNVFPLHPHEPDSPFSNRAHNASERDTGLSILEQLIGVLKPKRLIAIGNDAEQAVSRVRSSQEVVKVRHPSYGGQAQFINGITDLYSSQMSRSLQTQFIVK